MIAEFTEMCRLANFRKTKNSAITLEIVLSEVCVLSFERSIYVARHFY